MPAISAQLCHHEYRQAFFIGLGPELCLVPFSFDSFFKIVFMFSSFCFLFFSCSFQNLCYYLPLHFFTSLILSQGVPTSHLSLASLQSSFHFILPPTYPTAYPNIRLGSCLDITRYPTETDLGFPYCQSCQYIESINLFSSFRKKKKRKKKKGKKKSEQVRK